MTQKISTRECQKTLAQGTETLIQQEFLTSSSRKILLNPLYLDDEKLPDAERIAVLREVFHRNIRLKQLKRLARHLSTILGGALPPNLLVYGPSGAGKSVTCLHFLSTLTRLAQEKGEDLKYFYVDLTTPRTCFGALNELAMALDGSVRRYRKGIALEHMQEAIIAALQGARGFACVLVDEVDNVTTNADLFFTFLTKTLPKRVRARLFYVFLTNRVNWERSLDPRILSVLKKQDVIFEPYDALDLVEILKLRVEKALDSRRVDVAALRKIAAHASRETGDARRAVELLAKAVKIAEDTSGRLTAEEVDVAERGLEVDKTQELIDALASQQRLALRACYLGFRVGSGRLSTGDAFQCYERLCVAEGSRALSQRRFSDVVSFLDVYGLVNARVTCKGRYGKTRELSGSLPAEAVEGLLRSL